MYVAWFALYFGVFLLDPSLWLALLFLPAVLLTHYLAILPEEKVLKRKFGVRYEQYRKRVRRYL
jgi:protein-S-isoprenylcysteine O-methyltransferase Ste14